MVKVIGLGFSFLSWFREKILWLVEGEGNKTKVKRKAYIAAGFIFVAILVVVTKIATWKPLEIEASKVYEGGVVTELRTSGVIHVHTTYSDGGGSVEEVAKAASEAGLGFVVVTDHDTFAAKQNEGYIDDVLVIVGAEISTTDGHLIGFGIPTPTFKFSGDVRDALFDINDFGGVAFVAHPTSPRVDFRWRDWNLRGDWGVELLNGDTQWRSAGWIQAAWSTLLYPINPKYALLSLMTMPTTVGRWDKLLAERDVSVIVGSDSHSYIGLLEAGGIHFPSYESVFELAKNHVVLKYKLSGDSDYDKSLIVDALAKGSSYIALDAIAPADGFFFIAEDGNQQWSMGETVIPTSSLRLRAGGALPLGARLSLIKDGELVTAANQEIVWSDVSPGVYRIQVGLPGLELPWIFSNAIYVFDDQKRKVRQERLQGKTETVPARFIRQIDPLDESTAFFIAGDPSTLIEEEFVVDTAALDGSSVVRLQFVLGTPSEESLSPFAALTNFESQDLSDGDGLTLRVKADGVYRFYLQVRDRNPFSERGGGTEWWSASIKTSTDWQRVVIPFSQFLSSDPASDGQLDLEEVEGLVVLFDTGTVPSGTAGVAWFNDLSLYVSR